jgi:hypothetical protein
MLCIAPGRVQKLALRRDELRPKRVFARYIGYPRKCPNFALIVHIIQSFGYMTNFWSNFTLHLSGFGIGKGRLGEVVSLVGDCRPPPPGNPRQPTGGVDHYGIGRSIRATSSSSVSSGFCSTLINSKHGGIYLSDWYFFSLLNSLFSAILKKLNYHQYFKITCSYFSCTGKERVLECGASSLPPMWVKYSEAPAYSDYKCSRNREDICVVLIADMMNQG